MKKREGSDCTKAKNEVKCVSVLAISEEFQRQVLDAQPTNDLSDNGTRHKTKGTTTLPPNHEVKHNAAIADLQKFRSMRNAQPKLMKQVVASIIVGLSRVGVGFMHGFSGVTFPQMTQPDSDDLYLTPNNVALYGSLVPAGVFCGGILIGPFIPYIGLRKTLLLSLPASLAFWLLLSFSPGVSMLLAARMGTGILAAATIITSNSYVLEIAHKTYRGVLYSFVAISEQCGCLLTYALGNSSLTWRQQSLICSIIFSTTPFIGLIFFPESPRWLVTRGRVEEAKKSLIFFRGTEYDSQSELNNIIHNVNTANRQTSSNQFAQLFERSNFKVVVSLLLLSTLNSWNGSFAVASYAVLIFQSLESNIDPYISTTLMGAFKVIGTLAFPFITDKVGRRQLLMWSSMAMAISLALFGAYQYFQNNEWVAVHLKWLPLISLLLYMVFLCAGFEIFSVIQGELLPTNIRSLGISLLTSVQSLGGFISVFAFPIISTNFGDFVAFWSFSLSCFLIAIYTYIDIPETKGQSLEEIVTKRVSEGSIHF